LEAVWAVIYTKGHNIVFKLAKTRCEYGFPFIAFSHLEAVKSGDDIKFSINLSLVKPFKGLIYKRYGVLILNYNSVKSFIVNIESDISSWLFSKKDRGGCGGYTGIDKPFIKILIDILLYS
jgi:hypothetical protein